MYFDSVPPVWTLAIVIAAAVIGFAIDLYIDIQERKYAHDEHENIEDARG